MERNYNVTMIKEKVNAVLSGRSSLFGSFLVYKSKKSAENMLDQLKKEGINCYCEKSKYRSGGYDIVFTDLLELQNKGVSLGKGDANG